MFLRKSRVEPLPVTMSAVRMGERVLQIGIDDPGLASALAAKVGLSGNAAIVVTDDADAARARTAAASGGVLVDVQVTPLAPLPFERRVRSRDRAQHAWARVVTRRERTNGGTTRMASRAADGRSRDDDRSRRLRRPEGPDETTTRRRCVPGVRGHGRRTRRSGVPGRADPRGARRLQVRGRHQNMNPPSAEDSPTVQPRAHPSSLRRYPA